MTYSDEQLSAFLDGELSRPEMEAIRNALAEDESLGDRLAELSAVDLVVRNTYTAIDEKPLPRGIHDLLATTREAHGNVTSLPLAQRLKRGAGRHLALAASLVLAVGVALGTLLNRSGDENGWQSISAVLDSRPSGTAVRLDSGESITPRLTFRDRAGNYCRLFDKTSGDRAAQSLACRQAGEWQLAATVYSEPGSDDLYRPAAGGSPLAELIDRRLDEGPFDRDEEAALIGKGWSKTH